MRRIVGATLAALGMFLFVLALLAHFYLPGQVVKFPLNEYDVTRLTGTNVTYFSQQSGQEVTGASVRASATTQGDVGAGNSGTAVWNNVTGIFDVTQTNAPTPTNAIEYSSERLAFDRRTGVLVNCCGAEINNKRPKMSGQGYVWPIGVQKRTYQLFDTTLLRAVPVQYTGTATVDGLNTYVFVEKVTHEKFGSATVPGSLIKLPNLPTVSMPEYLTATNTYYVDPGTGAPVKLIQKQDVTLADPWTGATDITILDGTLTSTPQTIADSVHTAKSDDNLISWVQDIGPLIAGLLGIVLLVLGSLLVISEPQEEYEYEDDEPVGAEA